MLATWHFHIEISSRCTLFCPRCARQEVPDGFVNTDLKLDFFKRNFTPQFIKQHVEKITFCGDDGDPIYAHDLIPVIDYIKSVEDIEIVIVTNGSYKKPEWWSELGSVLTRRDSVHFSLDGWDQDSNNKYRVNCDWESIITGINSLRANTQATLIWAAIAFKFNEDNINLMQTMAEQLGMDRFQLTKSTKFGSIYPAYGNNDELEPSGKYVSSTKRFEREIVNFTKRENQINGINLDLYRKTKAVNGILPLCKIGNKGLYISAQGLLFPCCWVANRYNHNNEWQQLAKSFDLNKRDLRDCVQDKFWVTELETYRWQECKTKCNASVVDENYATEW